VKEKDKESDAPSMPDQRLSFLKEKMATQLFTVVDKNKDGKVSRVEWQAHFDGARHEKEFITPDDLREAMALSALRKPPVRLLAVFKAETGSIFEGPRVGDVAPDFTLPTEDGKAEINLTKYRANRPLVLVFGNFT
jgi:hypothetical protein